MPIDNTLKGQTEILIVLKVCFYNIDLMKWGNNCQQYNQESLEMSKPKIAKIAKTQDSRNIGHGLGSPYEYDRVKLIHEISTPSSLE